MELVSSFLEFQLPGIEDALKQAEIPYKVESIEKGFNLFTDKCNYKVARELALAVEHHQLYQRYQPKSK